MKTTARSVIDYFGLKVINGDAADLEREISSATINRAGLQLGGFQVNDYYRSTVVAWGTKEHIFFKSRDPQKLPEIIRRAISVKTPVLILSRKFNGKIRDLILEEASKLKIPVVQVPVRIADISVPLSSLIAQKNDKPKVLHGCLVIINGVGVMITGPSGIGKSEAVLELIHNNHVFVSDDSIVLFKVGQVLYGRSPSITQDLLEARGIGILNVPQIYGQRAISMRARIELEVEIVPEEELNSVDRLGNSHLTKNHLGFETDLIKIPAAPGRSLAILIEAATNVYLSRKRGANPIDLIKARTKAGGTNHG